MAVAQVQPDVSVWSGKSGESATELAMSPSAFSALRLSAIEVRYISVYIIGEQSAISMSQSEFVECDYTLFSKWSSAILILGCC